jgi:hypothetical protein
MNIQFVKEHGQQILIVVLLSLVLFYAFRFCNSDIKNDKLKVQNLDKDSEAKQVKIDYLQKEIERKINSSDSLAALRINDSITLSKLQAENDRLKKGMHEKYNAITRMDGDKLFDFFAKLDTGSVD